MAAPVHRSSPPQPTRVAACALLALACSGGRDEPPSMLGGQTGDEGTSQYARTAGSGSRICDFEESAFDPSTTTAFGVGMDELMATFESSAPVAFHWSNAKYGFGDGTFTHLPGPGSTALELQVSRDGGQPLYEIRNKPFAGQEGFGLCNGVFYEVPVTLRLATADGALDEVARAQAFDLSALAPNEATGHDSPPPARPLPVVITVPSPHTAYLQHRFDLERLTGNFELSSTDSTWDSATLDANVWLYRGASTGRLELSLGNARRTSPAPAPTCGSSDPCGSPAPAPAAPGAPLEEPFAPERARYIGTWPSPLSCSNGMPPLPPDTNLVGSSAADVTRLLAAATPLARSSASASTLSLGFDPLPAELCQGLTGTAVLFIANARLSESGLGFDLGLPLQVIARLDAAGQLGSIDVSRSGWEQPITAEQLAAIGLELAEAADFDDLYLQLTARYTRQDTAWLGSAELRVHGRSPDPECLAAEAASRDAATDSSPRASPGCGRAEVASGDNGAIPTGTPLLHHTWLAGD